MYELTSVSVSRYPYRHSVTAIFNNHERARCSSLQSVVALRLRRQPDVRGDNSERRGAALERASNWHSGRQWTDVAVLKLKLCAFSPVSNVRAAPHAWDAAPAQGSEASSVGGRT